MRTHGFLAFLLGVCITAAACLYAIDAQERQIRSDFQRDADKIVKDTRTRLKIYFDMLLSLKGMFASHDNSVDRERFARFVRELDFAARYPGFQAIQFVRPVPAERLASFVAEVRGDTRLNEKGYPDFSVHPVVERGQHYIVDYVEPMTGNERAFGLDLAALPPHLQALERGIDSGDIVATPRVVLVQDASQQSGFVARAPIYRRGAALSSVAQRREALVGFVAIVFRVDNLMREVIEASAPEHMAIRIHDVGYFDAQPGTADGDPHKGPKEPSGDSMFDDATSMSSIAPGAAARGAPLAELTTRTRLNVGGRAWAMEFTARAGGRYERSYGLVAFIAAAGTIISALVGAAIVASTRRRILAEQLRASLDEQRAYQDSASVGIALFAHGKIVRCNRGLETMMGYGAGELDDRLAAILLPPSASIDPFVTAGQTRVQDELELKRKDASTVWCMVHGQAFDAADVARGVVWVIQDIGERKKAEAALLEAKSGLERSLSELERQRAEAEAARQELADALAALNHAQTDLITAEKMASLGSLVAGIAHELNTPIGNSLLTATTLNDKLVEFEKLYAAGNVKRSMLEAYIADGKMACGIMASSLSRAADLIAAFKHVATDQTSDQRRCFKLYDILRDTLAAYSVQMRRAACTVELDAPTDVLFDSFPGSIIQVLGNLIDNALLHGFEGRAAGRIVIAVQETRSGEIKLTFSDDGVGMDAKTLKHVFDPFFTTKMGQGGSGLGMNIVYNIVTGMLGGTVKIVSNLGAGTRIMLTLPKKAP